MHAWLLSGCSTNMNYFIACKVAIPHLSNIHIRSLRNQKTHKSTIYDPVFLFTCYLVLHKDNFTLKTLVNCSPYKSYNLIIIKSTKMITRNHGVSLIKLNLFLRWHQKTKNLESLRSIYFLIVCEICED